MTDAKPKLPQPLSARDVRLVTDAKSLKFKTTDELQPLEVPIGQARALEAVTFAAAMNQPGYNVLAVGPRGSGKHTAIDALLRMIAEKKGAVCDRAYVFNFDDPRSPRALHLDAGSAARLKEAMDQAIDDLQTALPTVFEGSHWRQRREVIDQEFNALSTARLDTVRVAAEGQGLAMISGQQGISFAPVKDGQIVPPDDFRKWPEQDRTRVINALQAMDRMLQTSLADLPRHEKQRRDRLRALEREMAADVIKEQVDEVRVLFEGQNDAQSFLNDVAEDLLDHLHLFRPQSRPDGSDGETPEMMAAHALNGDEFLRYAVNVIVTNDPNKGAPVVYEPNPLLGTLIGRIEHRVIQGSAVTDFTLIRPGALHRANGGFLLVDANALFVQPAAWFALKRALRTGEIRYDILTEGNVMVTTTIDPDPVPLDVKVILFADRYIAMQLAAMDPDLGELFKVEADFDETVPRNAANEAEVGRLTAAIIRRNKLLPFDAAGVAAIIDEQVRVADDVRKISVMTAPLADLVREATYHARKAERRVAGAADVRAALAARNQRSERIREHSLDMIRDRKIMIETQGMETGRINGLTVLSAGNVIFGRPSRISAMASAGQGEVIDIEREVALSGPIHAKGVLILQGYLSGQFGQDAPLALRASVVFEQSYGGVEGDSASAAELLAILSAVANVPLRQDLAITGSISQHGRIQPIGGVNHKIEGFFEICKARGLTGTQGCVIPAANVTNLMLDEEVRDAIAAGRFSVTPIAEVDEAIAFFTGRDPEEVRAKARIRLAEFARIAREHASPAR